MCHMQRRTLHAAHGIWKKTNVTEKDPLKRAEACHRSVRWAAMERGLTVMLGKMGWKEFPLLHFCSFSVILKRVLKFKLYMLLDQWVILLEIQVHNPLSQALETICVSEFRDLYIIEDSMVACTVCFI